MESIIEMIKKESTFKNGMWVAVINITPEIAKEILKLNTANRCYNYHTAKRYSYDMINGNWKQNGVPIVISTDGVLKDGQHRLYACQMCNCVLENTLVIIQSPIETNCYDINRTRSTKDIAALEGLKGDCFRNNQIIAAARIITSYNHSANTVTKLEEIEFIEKNYDACSFAYENLLKPAKNSSVLRIRNSGILAAIISAYICGVTRSELLKFCNILVTGIAKDSRDIGVIKLRDYAISHEIYGITERKNLLVSTENTLYNFLQWKEVKYLTHSKTERFVTKAYQERL